MKKFNEMHRVTIMTHLLELRFCTLLFQYTNKTKNGHAVISNFSRAPINQ